MIMVVVVCWWRLCDDVFNCYYCLLSFLEQKVPPSKELSIDTQFVGFVFLIVIIVSCLEEKVAPSKELSFDILFVVVISIKQIIAL